MKIKEFKLERYFAKHEFSAPYLLSSSDCEALSLQELLDTADEEILDKWNNLKLGYTESLGHPILRQEISGLYNTINPDDILTIVPEEGIYLVMQNLLEKGDHIITTFPAYQSLYEIAKAIGCNVSKWIPKYRNGWKFEIDVLKNLINKKTKLIVINFPHNPTGTTIIQDDLNEIINMAQKQGIIIFSDEMYRFLEYESVNRLTSVADIYENAISLCGMSKSFALPGLRIGWITTKNADLLEKLARYKDYTTICSSAPSEILSIVALRAKENILERNLQIIHSNLTLLDDFFIKYSKLFDWQSPKAGPIAFPGLKNEISTTEFCENLIAKKGVMLVPASQFNYTENNFRIGFARKNMPEALGKFEEYLVENNFV